MNKKINSDKLMREKLSDFSVQPPSHIWDNVQGELVMQQKSKRMVYLRRISAAAVVLLAFIAGWYLNSSSEIEIPLAAEQQVVNIENSKENIVFQKEKNMSAELAIVEEAQNDNKQTENSNKNIQNRDNSLVAVTSKTKENSKTISTNSNNDRVEMELLASLNFTFENELPEMLLAVKSIPATEYSLTETDKFLIASNAKYVESKSNLETGWKVGLGITPGYSSYVVNHSESYSQNMTYSDESGNGNIGGGFSVQYKTSKKLRVESGVYYAQNGQTSQNTVQIAANRETSGYAMLSAERDVFTNAVSVSSNGNMAMNSNAGVIILRGTPKGAEINSELEAINQDFSNSIVTDGEFSQVFDFVEIPLYLRYRVLDSKFGIELIGGVNAGVVVGNNAYIDNSYGLQNIGETENISMVNLSGTVGVGLNYNLGKHISMAVEPRFNYYFNSINDNPEVDFRPYRIGVFTGLYYEF
ncbi:MAG: hypothetical protein GQ525_09765 [Draconibacterium sp.]|nr:hypothetical protein [Draconibacterium sp.]